MVKFARMDRRLRPPRSRLARAHTGRDLVAFCEDHPFFSYDDWFIGRPDEFRRPVCDQPPVGHIPYNDIASLKAVFDSHPGEVACVILEAERRAIRRGRLSGGRAGLCAAHGALFILDEMITGFRWDLGGAQAYYGSRPISPRSARRWQTASRCPR